MSFVNDGTIVSIVSSDAIQTAGQVVTRTNAAAGQVRLVDADGEYPYGVAFKSTEDPLNEGTYLTNQSISVQREGIAYVPLVADNEAIAAGDPIGAEAGTTYNGCCDKLTWASDSSTNLDISNRKLLGWAMEAKDALAGATWPTKIKVLLDIRTG